MVMTLRHLKTLVAVAEQGSFHAAASRLGVTQSAVSMQMKALEADLRVTLFDRERRPPVLNPLGRSLLERARDVVLRYEALRQAARAGEGVAGHLRLGVIPTAGTTLLPRALVELGALHPSLQLRLESDLSDALLGRVAQGALDAAVVTRPARLPAGLTAGLIVEEALVVIGQAQAGAPPGAAALWRDWLESRPFVRFNRRTGVGRIIDEALQAQGLAVREAMELDSVEAIRAMVSCGLGVAVVPAGSLAGPSARDLWRAPFGRPPVVRQVVLVEPESRPLAGLTEPLFAALRRRAEEQEQAGGDGLVS